MWKKKKNIFKNKLKKHNIKDFTKTFIILVHNIIIITAMIIIQYWKPFSIIFQLSIMVINKLQKMLYYQYIIGESKEKNAKIMRKQHKILDKSLQNYKIYINI